MANRATAPSNRKAETFHLRRNSPTRPRTTRSADPASRKPSAVPITSSMVVRRTIARSAAPRKGRQCCNGIMAAVYESAAPYAIS